MGYDFGLKSETVEIDRDADRRWATASRKMAMAEKEGKEYPDSSPLEELFPIANDAEHHENNVKTLEKLKEDSKGFKDLDAAWRAFSHPVLSFLDLLLPGIRLNLAFHPVQLGFSSRLLVVFRRKFPNFTH